MTNALQIQIVDGPEKAPNYNRDHVDIRGATISKVIVVKRGTVSSKPTVDFQFQDQQGAEYVAMLTGELVKQLGIIIASAEAGNLG
jgi:hypothetical protein